ncbi:hypothetical protein BTA51_21310 [Hahella sp. CCB-MM4]|uniref:pilus assembly PilX family protein n=1 Tax=Hahella sp. (strain CCB-MM4) TaxID=1926491 RepID=UPI000B9BCF60|nr:pilus assembly protein [Hahella sp. CCB-MM4]OZG71476.1 hypothetical protein BTA51_21310 [Hahella sp. CCB-MM4]
MNLPLKKQTGAALFLSLIFLLILTILGISSMSDSVMQTKMAGAVQDSNIALQGAESALKDAESFIEDNVASLSLFTDAGNNGLYSDASTAMPDNYTDSEWTDTKSKKASAITGLSTEPRYYIQYVGIVSDEDNTSINVNTYSHESGSGEIYGFKITARSTGGSGQTQRIIESYYGKRF